jgi:hypothetical protein
MELKYKIVNGVKIPLTEAEQAALQPSPYELAMQDWHEPTYALRIRAPKSLALEYPQMYVWFQINDLPIHKVGDEALLYCNEVLPEHQPLVDNLDSVTVENRPNPADYA